MNKNLTEPHDNVTYKFGPYQLDLNERMLTRDGETIALAPKVTDILIMLVTNAGQLVEKDELLKRVWPDTFVEEANLSQNIFMLRKALGDDRAEPKYIDTVMRRGYRFIGAVNVVDPDQPGEDSAAAEAAAPSRPVVAVLPFTNATGDPEWEYLADGLTDNLINNLSRVSKLRVMSQSAAFRYKTRDVDPRQVGREMHAQAVLVGKVNLWRSGIGIVVELVDSSTGWQLWGHSFDSETKDLLEIQDTITRQLLAALKLKLTGEEEKRVTVRYTENAEAYQSYLAGRYHWSRYTRRGIEKAIKHFRDAIELDSNYALAYAAIVDCYLRLATNYLPPEDDLPRSAYDVAKSDVNIAESWKTDDRVKLRFEWDWKGAERELRRAQELRTAYPSAHQWYAAYRETQQFYDQAVLAKSTTRKSKLKQDFPQSLLPQIASLELTPTERVQVYCAISREQIDAGNYEAAYRIFSPWWSLGKWPKLDGLNQHTCADLLFTVGEIAGCIASTRQLPQGQKHGEELLNGSIALFEQLGVHRRAAEGRIELALCYYRQGLFQIARSTLIRVLEEISLEDSELRSLALIRLASLERHAGRLNDAHARLLDASKIVELSGPWATGRCHLELASLYKDFAVCEELPSYSEEAKAFYFKAIYEFQAVGNHRLAAITDNNIGLLMALLGRFTEAEIHLGRARKTFDSFNDKIRTAQVDDSLARLYLAQERFNEAQHAIDRAVEIMEGGDEDALLAEALTTKGLIECKMKRYTGGKRLLESAYRLSRRRGDIEGAGRALTTLTEELSDELSGVERKDIAERLKQLLLYSEELSIRSRLQKSLEIVAKRRS